MLCCAVVPPFGEHQEPPPFCGRGQVRCNIGIAFSSSPHNPLKKPKKRNPISQPFQVRYGAEMVFSSSALNITDEDIDAIIQKGERDTAALNNKLKV